MKFSRTLLLSLSCLIFDANIALGNEANMPFKDEASRKADPICEHMIAKAGADLLRGFKKYGFDQIAEHIINCYNDEFEHIITKSKNPSVIQKLIKNDHILQRCMLEDYSAHWLIRHDYVDPEDYTIYTDKVGIDEDDADIYTGGELNNQYFFNPPATSRRFLFGSSVDPYTPPREDQLARCRYLTEDIAEPMSDAVDTQLRLQQEQDPEYGWIIRALKKQPGEEKD